MQTITLKMNLIKIFLVSCIILGCNAQESSIEDKLYACLVSHYTEQGIDLNESLDSIENYLVEKHILKSKDGLGKIKYYQEIINSGEIPGIMRTSLMDRLAEIYPLKNHTENCIFKTYKLDSVQYMKSTFFQISEKVKKEVDEMGELNPAIVTRALLNHLTAKDLEHPYYRAQMLLSYVLVADKDEAYIRQFPKQKVERNVNTKNAFIIDVISRSELQVNGQHMNEKDLEKALLDYLKTFDKTTCVQINTKVNTEYSYLSSINSLVEGAFLKYWDLIALREKRINFQSLNSIDQDKIKGRYPMKIIETLIE